MRGFFVTGTGTDVGKTYVTALLTSKLRDEGKNVGVYKPVASGCRRVTDKSGGTLVADDAVQLWEAAGKPLTLEHVTPQCFHAPLAPNVAAREEGKQVDGERLRTGLSAWTEYCAGPTGVLLVEGVGGLLSPVSDEDLVADLAVDFGFPLIVVVRNRLGCINDTLLTLRVAEQYGLEVCCVILNDVDSPDESASTNEDEIRRLAKLRQLDHVPFGATSIVTQL